MSTNTLILSLLVLWIAYLVYRDWKTPKTPSSSITDFLRRPNFYRLALLKCFLKTGQQITGDGLVIWGALSASVLKDWSTYDWVIFLGAAGMKIANSIFVTVSACLDNSFAVAEAQAKGHSPATVPPQQP